MHGESDLRRVNSIEVELHQNTHQSWDLHMMELQFMDHMHIQERVVELLTQMKSGYSLDLEPRQTIHYQFSQRDFSFKITPINKLTDESVLDENNGRFCVTPDYPQGTYAYFMTINESVSQNHLEYFQKYRRPVFPYIIGHNYHCNSK